MPIATKALQKTGPESPFEIAEIHRRDPRPDDIVIDIKAAGICHSDIHTVRNEWGRAHFPLTVGHEIAGVVSDVGSAVTQWQVGDRVGVGCLVNSCQECEQCLAGQEQDCLQGAVGTYNSQDIDGTITQGGYAQKIVVNEKFVCRIPDALDFDTAAPLLCAGITTYSPLARWNIAKGDKVAIVGLGGLGHMGVQIAKARGADVTVISRTLNKAEIAAQLGADRIIAAEDSDFSREHKRQFDFILCTISASLNLQDYLRMLKPHGIMAVVGLPSEALSLQLGSLILGGKVLAGSNIGGIRETQEMLDFCGEHGLGAWIEKISVDEVDTAYDRVVAGDVKFRFVIDTATFE